MTFTLKQLKDAGLPDVLKKKRPVKQLIKKREKVKEINIYGVEVESESVIFEEVVIGEEEYYDTDYDQHVTFTESLTPEQWQTFVDIRDGNGYAEKRKRAYPPIEELADALYHKEKGDDALLQEYLSKVGEVKLRYPKENF